MKDGRSGVVLFVQPPLNGIPARLRVRLTDGQVVRSVRPQDVDPVAVPVGKPGQPWIGFDLDNAPGQQPGGRRVHQQLAQQARGHLVRGSLKEGAGKQAARGLRQAVFPDYLWAFFHSLRISRTSSACPSGLTLGKICSRV